MKKCGLLYYWGQAITAGVACLLVVVLLSACSSSDDPKPGADGDWEAADLVESDPDNAADDDADTSDSPVDRDESDADLPENDGDAEDTVDENEAEEDIEYPELPEQEEREPPEMLPEDAYSTYSLLDRAELRSCDPEVTMDSPEFYWAVSVHRATNGTLYFGNRYGLWRLEESPSEALVCVPGIEETVWSITSRRVGDSHELWVGLDGRAGVLRDDTWEFIDVPQEWKHEDADYNGPLSSMVWKVAVNDQYEVIQTTQGVAFRQGSGGFQVIDWCPEGALVLPDMSLAGESGTYYNKAVNSSSWAGMIPDGEVLYVGGRQAIYALNIPRGTCSAQCKLGGNDDRHYILAGMQEDYIKAVRCKPKYDLSTFPFPYYPEPHTVDLETGFCAPGNQWRTEDTAWYTFAATAADSRVMASAFPVYSDVRPEEELAYPAHGRDKHYLTHIYHMLLLTGQEHSRFARFTTLSTGTRHIGDYNIPTIVTVSRSSVEWSAELIIDQGGYWYSPGFTRIEVEE